MEGLQMQLIRLSPEFTIQQFESLEGRVLHSWGKVGCSFYNPLITDSVQVFQWSYISSLLTLALVFLSQNTPDIFFQSFHPAPWLVIISVMVLRLLYAVQARSVACCWRCSLSGRGAFLHGCLGCGRGLYGHTESHLSSPIYVSYCLQWSGYVRTTT